MVVVIPRIFRSTKRLKLDQTRVRGLLFALCCHHCCSWSSYVGREFLEKLGFTPYHFHILCCLSSWATCGSRKTPPSEKREPSEKLESSCQDLGKQSEAGTREGEKPSENNDCPSRIKAVHIHSTSEADEGSCIKYVYFNWNARCLDMFVQGVVETQSYANVREFSNFQTYDL